MDLTDEQRYENYKRLGLTIRHIEKCAKDQKGITEDWIEEHKIIIQQYRDAFPNLSRVNLGTPGLDDDFFNTAYEGEIYLSWLIRNLKEFGSPASLRMYLKLNLKLKKLADESIKIEEVCEFDKLLNKMEHLAIK
jgi:hypothetical protein